MWTYKKHKIQTPPLDFLKVSSTQFCMIARQALIQWPISPYFQVFLFSTYSKSRTQQLFGKSKYDINHLFMGFFFLYETLKAFNRSALGSCPYSLRHSESKAWSALSPLCRQTFGLSHGLLAWEILRIQLEQLAFLCGLEAIYLQVISIKSPSLKSFSRLPGREHQNGARTSSRLSHGSGLLVPF